MNKILQEIKQERARQTELWGQQDHTPETWMLILGEEVGECNKAILDNGHFVERVFIPGNNFTELRNELIQVAAVAVQIVEWIDRK